MGKRCRRHNASALLSTVPLVDVWRGRSLARLVWRVRASNRAGTNDGRPSGVGVLMPPVRMDRAAARGSMACQRPAMPRTAKGIREIGTDVP
jgi:hypothetical protein